jgi:hypothetical protein
MRAGGTFQRPATACRQNREARVKLRADEEFAAKALSQAFEGHYRVGDDPPDIYLIKGDREIAVEISTLAQYVHDEKGERPRRSVDTTAARLADELNEEISVQIEDGSRVGLILTTPINRFQETKRALRDEILAMLSATKTECKEQTLFIENNRIEIFLYRDGELASKKVAALILTTGVCRDVLKTIMEMLERRIVAKSVSCAALLKTRDVWLALLRGHYFTDLDKCRVAYNQLRLPHLFAKILLIESDGSVGSIYSRE